MTSILAALLSCAVILCVVLWILCKELMDTVNTLTSMRDDALFQLEQFRAREQTRQRAEAGAYPHVVNITDYKRT